MDYLGIKSLEVTYWIGRLLLSWH